MEICKTGAKTFAIAMEEILIFLKIRLTERSPLEIEEKILEIAVRTGVVVGKITRIAGEIGVITKGIFRVTEDTEVITEEASGVSVVTGAITEAISGVSGDTEVTTEEISRATEDSDEIIKGISEPIAKFKGITNDIIPHDYIIGSHILPSATGINIQVELTEVDAGVSLTDVRLFSV